MEQFCLLGHDQTRNPKGFHSAQEPPFSSTQNEEARVPTSATKATNRARLSALLCCYGGSPTPHTSRLLAPQPPGNEVTASSCLPSSRVYKLICNDQTVSASKSLDFCISFRLTENDTLLEHERNVLIFTRPTSPANLCRGI